MVHAPTVSRCFHWILLACLVLSTGGAFAADVPVKATQNTRHLMPYQVLELTFQHDGKYADPTWDVTIDVTLTSPAGKQVTVGGFFYGSSKPQKPVVRTHTDGRGRTRLSAEWPCKPADLWKARYAPSAPGRWRYEWTWRDRRGGTARGAGEFRVVAGRVKKPGWVRVHPQNPRRFVFDNGRPFWPVGFQDGVFDPNHNGSAMDESSMEGPFRTDNLAKRPKTPPGAMFVRGPSMNPQNWDVHFGRHSRAGFNLWRFSPHNFSIPVFDIHYDAQSTTPARIRWEQARMVDEMLRMTRKYGMRNMYGIFGFAKVFNDHPEDAKAMAKIKGLIKYSVDRWGAYVDIWELLNEQKASTGWYKVTAAYLKSIDPYHRPVATSWERPELDGIDVTAPHWYGNENELQSDATTVGRARRFRRFAKPIVFGEQGNSRGRADRSAEGIGGVWDPGSARRMRVRLWTGMFQEMALVFWETSYARDGHFMNLWIGPEERQYVKALQDFSHCLAADVRLADVHLAGRAAGSVRAYGLRGARHAAVYLHHGQCDQCSREHHAGKKVLHRWDHRRGTVEGLRVTVDVPVAAKGYWYAPRTAAIVKRVNLTAGRHELAAPAFEIDLALLVTPDGPPDADGDGKANDVDTDADNDGTPDDKDAFPLEREEQTDADADRIGDSLDADVNADGKADDLNRNGIPDNQEKDWDGDGVPNASAVPWDAFPRDPKEWRDTDGDGIGDHADPDDDGDGWSDDDERRRGTDPLDPVSFPTGP